MRRILNRGIVVLRYGILGAEKNGDVGGVWVWDLGFGLVDGVRGGKRSGGQHKEKWRAPIDGGDLPTESFSPGAVLGSSMATAVVF